MNFEPFKYTPVMSINEKGLIDKLEKSILTYTILKYPACNIHNKDEGIEYICSVLKGSIVLDKNNSADISKLEKFVLHKKIPHKFFYEKNYDREVAIRKRLVNRILRQQVKIYLQNPEKEYFEVLLNQRLFH